MYFLIAGYSMPKKKNRQNRILRELQQSLEMQCLEWFLLIIGFFAAKCLKIQ
jgi:hypothetical protein